MAIVINGSGTVTGLAVGGLPDGTVDAGTLATNSVDSAELIDGAVDRSHLATSIADSGNATAITITSSEHIGIGVTDPAVKLEVRGVISAGASTDEVLQEWAIGSDNVKANIEYTDASTSRAMNFGTSTAHDLILKTSDTTRLTVTHDGKGRSLFTAGAWFHAEGAGTPSFHQSHNCSSIESMGSAGYYRVNWDTDFANGNYAVVNNAHRDSYEDQSIYNLTYGGGSVRYVYVQDSTGGIDIADFSSLVFGA